MHSGSIWRRHFGNMSVAGRFALARIPAGKKSHVTVRPNAHYRKSEVKS